MRKTYLEMLHRPDTASESNEMSIEYNAHETDLSYINPVDNLVRANSVSSIKSFPPLNTSGISDTNRLSISSLRSQYSPSNLNEGPA